MTTLRTRAILAHVVALLVVAPALAGDIVGKVKYAGTAPAPQKLTVTKDQAVCGKAEHIDESLLVGPDKGVKNVVVNINDPKDGKKYTAASGKPTLDQNGCKFVPHIDIVPAGQEVTIINSDGILHNIHTFPKNNPQFNKAQPKFKKEMPATFANADIVQIKCDVHSWMQGWIVVAGHAYYALTDAAGNFKIAGVPAGTYTIDYWQEKLGKQSKQVTVPATGSVTADLEYAAK